jgi:type I restriction enzyme S subunit
MTDWHKTTLGQVIELQRGHDLPERDRKPGFIPVIGSAGPNGWHDTAKAPGPGVTVGRSGASVGVVTFVREPFWPHNTVLYVKDFKGNDPRFVSYLLMTLPLAELNSGAAQPSLNRNFLYPVPVSIPRPEDQRRIASFLGTYDDLIEVNRRRIALLEQTARRLFEEWVVRFQFPGHADCQFIETPDGAIPHEWHMGEADELIEFDPPTALPREGRKPFIPMDSLATDTSLITAVEWRDGLSGAKFKNGDTLFARITPCLENGKTGIVRNLPGAGFGFGSTEFIVMRGRVAGPAYCYLLARLEAFRHHARKSMSGASGRQRVRTESIRTFKLAVPPADILSRFELVAWPLLELSGVLGATNGALRSARDLILPRLVSGELTIPTAERELETAA